MSFLLGYDTGSGITVYRFETYDRLREWNHSVTEIKFHADAIHQYRQAGETKGDEEDYGFWIDLVKQFISRHGKQYVPTDIRSALNNIERNLDRPLTEW
jgi:hypothetical protein